MNHNNKQVPITLLNVIFEYTFIQLFCKYNSTQLTYLIKKVDELVFNDPTIYSAKFKEYLLYQDDSEFLRRYYNKHELPKKLKYILTFYHKYSKIFPNYTIMEGSKYLYKNIQKKQKMINNLQELKQQEKNNKIHSSTNTRRILSDSALGVILNESNSFYMRNIYEIFNIQKSSSLLYFSSSNLNINDSINEIDKIISSIEHSENRSRNLSPKIVKHNNLILKQELGKIHLHNIVNSQLNLHLLYKYSSIINNINKNLKYSINTFNKNSTNNSSNNSKCNSPNKTKLFSPRNRNYKTIDQKGFSLKNKFVLNKKGSLRTVLFSPATMRNSSKQNSIDNNDKQHTKFTLNNERINSRIQRNNKNNSICSGSGKVSGRKGNNSIHQINKCYNTNSQLLKTTYLKSHSTLNIHKIKSPKNEYLTERQNSNKKITFFNNNNNNNTLSNKKKQNNKTIKRNQIHNLDYLTQMSKIKTTINSLSGSNSRKNLLVNCHNNINEMNIYNNNTTKNIKNSNNNTNKKIDFFEIFKEGTTNKLKFQHCKNKVKNIYVQHS